MNTYLWNWFTQRKRKYACWKGMNQWKFAANHQIITYKITYRLIPLPTPNSSGNPLPENYLRKRFFSHRWTTQGPNYETCQSHTKHLKNSIADPFRYGTHSNLDPTFQTNSVWDPGKRFESANIMKKLELESADTLSKLSDLNTITSKE